MTLPSSRRGLPTWLTALSTWSGGPSSGSMSSPVGLGARFPSGFHHIIADFWSTGVFLATSKGVHRGVCGAER